MLTEETKEEIKRRFGKYPNKRSAVMDALRLAQRAGVGNVTKKDMEEVAGVLGMNPVEVNAIAAFYTMYNVKKLVGRHHIQVCKNISCSLLGAEHIIEHMEKKLRIKTGETTKNNKFTLSTVECL